MPNWCYFNMLVGGRRENVDLFVGILYNGYDQIHMCRINDIDICNTEDYGMYRRVEICGECAWSVYCCMFDGPASYFGDHVRDTANPPHPRIARHYKLPTGVTTNIIALSKQLELDISIHSEEPGMCFCELYHIKNGEVLTEETGKYEELWIGESDTWDDLVDYYSGPSSVEGFTKDEFDAYKAHGERNIIHSDFGYNDMIAIGPRTKPVFETKQRLYRVLDKDK